MFVPLPGKHIGASKDANSEDIQTVTSVSNADICATYCNNNANCVGFAFGKQQCTLLKKDGGNHVEDAAYQSQLCFRKPSGAHIEIDSTTSLFKLGIHGFTENPLFESALALEMGGGTLEVDYVRSGLWQSAGDLEMPVVDTSTAGETMQLEYSMQVVSSEISGASKMVGALWAIMNAEDEPNGLDPYINDVIYLRGSSIVSGSMSVRAIDNLMASLPAATERRRTQDEVVTTMAVGGYEISVASIALLGGNNIGDNINIPCVMGDMACDPNGSRSGSFGMTFAVGILLAEVEVSTFAFSMAHTGNVYVDAYLDSGHLVQISMPPISFRSDVVVTQELVFKTTFDNYLLLEKTFTHLMNECTDTVLPVSISVNSATSKPLLGRVVSEVAMEMEVSLAADEVRRRLDLLPSNSGGCSEEWFMPFDAEDSWILRGVST